MATNITDIVVRDVRFPTSKEAHGSDAMHQDPDYSAAYVIIKSSSGEEGHGLTFTLGRGTEIIVKAIESIKRLIVGKFTFEEIIGDFQKFWRAITSESQLRWVGPEKGVVHMAVGAVVNGLWDFWAKREKKPLWRLLCDLTPEQLVSTIDFRYLTDVLTPEEAIEILKEKRGTMDARIKQMEETGFPAYTTSAGWLGYTDEKITELVKTDLSNGWENFKVKVGANIDDDIRRCKLFRELIGWERNFMMDANQRWEVSESIENMKKLAQFKPLWIEEPTCPDDIIGHQTIAKAIAPYGIGVATGEQCQNRVIFKQLIANGAISFCQIDSCRIGGVNEILSVILMAAKHKIPVCPHAGGVGLCEHVQHLSIFDYVAVSGSLDKRLLEYVNHLHEHFVDPVVMKNGHYQVPKLPGYSIEMKPESLDTYDFVTGTYWLGERKKGGEDAAAAAL